MPFKSKAQMRYMFATHPKMAREFADATKNIKELPEKKDEEWEKIKKLARRTNGR